MNKRRRTIGLRLSAGLVYMSILMFSGCSSHSGVLFYRPPGTTTEVYKTHPEALQLTVYPESTPGIHTGAVVFIHGGGWQAKGSDLPLYWDWHARVQNAHLRAFSLEHRAAPTYRGHDLLEDTLDAVAYIRQHANRFRIPPDKIALVGFSSGGHLAVLTALAASTPRPGRYERHPGGIRAAISFYGPLDPEGLLEYGNPAARNLLLNYLPEFRDYSANQSDGGAQQRSFLTQSLKDISPIYRLHYRAPRMLLLHGAKDELIPPKQSEVLAEKARVIRPDMAELRVIADAEHNFCASRKPWARQIESDVLAFIQTEFAR